MIVQKVIQIQNGCEAGLKSWDEQSPGRPRLQRLRRCHPGHQGWQSHHQQIAAFSQVVLTTQQKKLWDFKSFVTFLQPSDIQHALPANPGLFTMFDVFHFLHNYNFLHNYICLHNYLQHALPASPGLLTMLRRADNFSSCRTNFGTGRNELKQTNKYEKTNKKSTNCRRHDIY